MKKLLGLLTLILAVSGFAKADQSGCAEEY